ncbi:olfactory receptor 10A5-like [Pleurodeles waltl]|uniref:olfactory receptor 10A5-like n=1 Tax=Pleurodeles waltl TaxID=8319 RepID=UPI003709B0A4
MVKGNQTRVWNFILMGFSDLPVQQQVILFITFLTVYLVTVMGNLLTIVLVTVDRRLHTPMYFFLRSLSFLDICYINVTVPNMLKGLLSTQNTILFLGCAVQMYFFICLATIDCFLLAVMAYDRYVAICYPLRYPTIMNKSRCTQLVVYCWSGGFLLSMGQTTFIFSLQYCGSNVIAHFFCDIPPVIILASTDTFFNQVAIFIYTIFVILGPFLLILSSYVRILSTVLKMQSVSGMKKAFSTCTSHLFSVSLLYASGTVMYLRPTSSHSQNTDRLLALFYVLLMPMFNPIIYSLRNKEMKEAFWKLILTRML